MTLNDAYTGRRGVLKKLGAILTGWAGLPLTGISERQAEAGVFAGLFAKDGNSILLPPGYYDSTTQLYHDAETRKPMFVAQAGSEAKQLTEQELAELLRSGRFVDISKGQFSTTGAWCTLSQRTTLSTTRCCPIVTDTQSETECDDTPR